MKEDQLSSPSRYVTGIGGFFFRAKNPDLLSKWYEKYFMIPHVKNYQPWDQEAGPTVFAPFKEDTEYFGRREQPFMLNFRVRELDNFLAFLKSSGVQIDDKIQDEGYGRFAWVYDLEGNKVELWETTEDNQETK